MLCWALVAYASQSVVEWLISLSWSLEKEAKIASRASGGGIFKAKVSDSVHGFVPIECLRAAGG